MLCSVQFDYLDAVDNGRFQQKISTPQPCGVDLPDTDDGDAGVFEAVERRLAERHERIVAPVVRSLESARLTDERARDDAADLERNQDLFGKLGGHVAPDFWNANRCLHTSGGDR